MKVIRYTESLSKPKDTMFIEIDEQHRFTRRGQNWAKFRKNLIQVLKETISDELAEEFEQETADWESAAAP